MRSLTQVAPRRQVLHPLRLCIVNVAARVARALRDSAHVGKNCLPYACALVTDGAMHASTWCADSLRRPRAETTKVRWPTQNKRINCQRASRGPDIVCPPIALLPHRSSQILFSFCSRYGDSSARHYNIAAGRQTSLALMLVAYAQPVSSASGVDLPVDV